ncbi:MAG: porphobilinogen synthase [Candidatus Eiseniibacteriota bacterium]
MMELPHRPRRLRRTPAWRGLVRETQLSVDDLVLPLFVREGEGVREPIPSMPGCCRLSIDALVEEAGEAHRLGIPGIILFGIPAAKDARGSQGYDPQGIIPRAVRAVKAAVPDLLVWADVCLCEYTGHGHCGVVEDGRVLNDPTVELLAKAAVVYAEVGADAVCPSDMMDGRVGEIRRALDARGFTDTVIVSYAAKYASAFYGPFRDAAGSTPAFGDRRAYQMDSANAREALREIELDITEGADIVMVKPALAYLDVVHEAAARCAVPIAAYNVSGEYSMVKAAAAAGWLDERAAVLETLGSIRRAGAKILLTYHAKEVARWIG